MTSNQSNTKIDLNLAQQSSTTINLTGQISSKDAGEIGKITAKSHWFVYMGIAIFLVLSGVALIILASATT